MKAAVGKADYLKKDVTSRFLDEDGFTFWFIILSICILLAAFFLYFISKKYPIRKGHAWRQTKLYECKELRFFLNTASAYRRIFIFFTAVSYLLKILGVITTFFMVFFAIKDGTFKSIMLFFSALFDSVALLFPFQRYIDLFSKCCILMEEGILRNDARVAGSLCDNEKLRRKIYLDLEKIYIKCEEQLHVHNNI